MACTTTATDGSYLVALPSTFPPGDYSIQALFTYNPDVPAVVNYRYPDAAQTPIPNQTDPRLPDQDVIPLVAGVNEGVDVYVPQPVLLIHGVLVDQRSWAEAEALLRLDPKWKSRSARPPGWDPRWSWPGGVGHRGYIAVSLTYTLSYFEAPLPIPGFWLLLPDHMRRTHAENAAFLQLQVDAVRGVLAAHMDRDVPFDVAGHSMGGLVTRAYLHQYAPQNSVDRVFTFGTPHAGVGQLLGCSTPTGCVFSFTLCGYGFLLAPYTYTALSQMDPAYMLGTFNPQITRTAGARFICVGSNQNWSPCEPEVINFPFTWDDGFVSTYSALFPVLGMPGFPWLRARLTPDHHFHLHSNTPNRTLNEILLGDLETAR